MKITANDIPDFVVEGMICEHISIHCERTCHDLKWQYEYLNDTDNPFIIAYDCLCTGKIRKIDPCQAFGSIAAGDCTNSLGDSGD